MSNYKNKLQKGDFIPQQGVLKQLTERYKEGLNGMNSHSDLKRGTVLDLSNFKVEGENENIGEDDTDGAESIST